MKTIVIASHNPVKISAARRGFELMFPGEVVEVVAVSVPSGVAAQPMTNDETLTGALNRSANAKAAHPNADLWIGLEGGIEDRGENGMWAFAWAVARSAQAVGQARTAIFTLPPKVAELVRGGKELGEADDIVFGRVNSKQSDGAVGLLTGGALDRASYYTQAVMLALVPFKNPELYLLPDESGEGGSA